MKTRFAALGVAAALLAAGARAEERPSTKTGIYREFKAFPSTVLNNVRKVTVFLPPSYETSPTRRYSVLYAHDGQNLFDERGSFIGKEWKMDETLTAMWKDYRIPEMIVVGIDNTKDRMKEYMPGPDGDRYIKFLATELKPFIDNRFRTKRDASHTGLLGSSMGALISIWGSLTRPDVFEHAAGLSPAIQFAADLRTRMEQERPRHIHWYLDIGTEEADGEYSKMAVQVFNMAVDGLMAGGYVEGQDFKAVVVQGGKHNEEAWAARLDKALEFMFGPRKPAS